MMLDPLFAVVLRGALALLFGAAALHKLRAPRVFTATLEDYALLPAALVSAAAAGLAALEAGLALALLVPGAERVAALGGAGLLVLYSGAIAINLWRGRRAIDCGCLGPAGRQPLSGGLLWRNALLAGACLALAAPVAERPLVWLDALAAAAGVAALALLFSAAQRLAFSTTALAEPGRST